VVHFTRKTHAEQKTKTVLCNCLPTEFRPKQTPPTKAIANVYKLKTQPEIVCYYHAAVGFPTKPTWVMTVKNRQFPLWPGLTAKAVTKHFPELEETTKGHGCKIQSKPRSTMNTASDDSYINNKEDNTAPNPPPSTAPHHKTVQGIHKIYDFEVKAQLKMYTDQTKQFPSKLSRGDQCIMVLIELDSNAILVDGGHKKPHGR
jgi:hypothetical protein